MFGKRKAPPGQTVPEKDKALGARLVAPDLLEVGSDKREQPGRDSVIAYLMSAYAEPGGRLHARLHIETLLSAVGALAGFAAQVAVRAMAADQGVPIEKVMLEVQVKDGS